MNYFVKTVYRGQTRNTFIQHKQLFCQLWKKSSTIFHFHLAKLHIALNHRKGHLCVFILPFSTLKLFLSWSQSSFTLGSYIHRSAVSLDERQPELSQLYAVLMSEKMNWLLHRSALGKCRNRAGKSAVLSNSLTAAIFSFFSFYVNQAGIGALMFSRGQ